MHLADGILTQPGVSLAANLVGIGGVLVLALRRIDTLPPARLAWAGTLGAFIVAAQTINLPVAPGVSAHAIGASLVTLLVGPALGIVVLSAVLLIQTLLLADGGLTVLGINMLNIAILPSLTVAGAARLFGRDSAAAAIGGTALGSLIAAGSLAALLVFGAGAPVHITVPLLLGVQTAAGVVEGIMTWFAVRALRRQASHLLGEAPRRLQTLDDEADALLQHKPAFRWAAVAVCLLLALLPLATSSPDALEVVMQRLSAPNR